MKYNVVEVESNSLYNIPETERVVASFSNRMQAAEFVENRGKEYNKEIVSKHPNFWNVDNGVGEYSAENTMTGHSFAIKMKMV